MCIYKNTPCEGRGDFFHVGSALSCNVEAHTQLPQKMLLKKKKESIFQWLIQLQNNSVGKGPLEVFGPASCSRQGYVHSY